MVAQTGALEENERGGIAKRQFTFVEPWLESLELNQRKAKVAAIGTETLCISNYLKYFGKTKNLNNKKRTHMAVIIFAAV